MTTHALEPSTTRQHLLDAAVRVFAERGFHGASIRDICERAGANIASANYHFHGKEKLYRAVLEYACQRIRAPQSLSAKRPIRQTPEEKLRAGIRSLFWSLMQQDDAPWLIRLVVRQLAEQGSPFDCVAAALWTYVAQLEETLRELLGPDASRDCVYLCALSVVSQCVFFCAAQSSLQRLCPELGKRHSGREQLVAHVARFTEAALAHWKEGPARPGITRKQCMKAER